MTRYALNPFDTRAREQRLTMPRNLGEDSSCDAKERYLRMIHSHCVLHIFRLGPGHWGPKDLSLHITHESTKIYIHHNTSSSTRRREHTSSNELDVEKLLDNPSTVVQWTKAHGDHK